MGEAFVMVLRTHIRPPFKGGDAFNFFREQSESGDELIDLSLRRRGFEFEGDDVHELAFANRLFRGGRRGGLKQTKRKSEAEKNPKRFHSDFVYPVFVVKRSAKRECPHGVNSPVT